MTRRKPDYVPRREILDQFRLASKLGRSEATLPDMLAGLYKEGFPHYDDLLGGWWEPAVDEWLRRRFNLAEVTDDLDARLKEFADG